MILVAIGERGKSLDVPQEEMDLLIDKSPKVTVKGGCWKLLLSHIKTLSIPCWLIRKDIWQWTIVRQTPLFWSRGWMRQLDVTYAVPGLSGWENGKNYLISFQIS